MRTAGKKHPVIRALVILFVAFIIVELLMFAYERYANVSGPGIGTATADAAEVATTDQSDGVTWAGLTDTTLGWTATLDSTDTIDLLHIGGHCTDRGRVDVYDITAGGTIRMKARGGYCIGRRIKNGSGRIYQHDSVKFNCWIKGFAAGWGCDGWGGRYGHYCTWRGVWHGCYVTGATAHLKQCLPIPLPPFGTAWVCHRHPTVKLRFVQKGGPPYTGMSSHGDGF